MSSKSLQKRTISVFIFIFLFAIIYVNNFSGNLPKVLAVNDYNNLEVTRDVYTINNSDMTQNNGNSEMDNINSKHAC